jgi:mRNA-degrading endonuclease RelE of RelBE toxin-antitoxin system
MAVPSDNTASAAQALNRRARGFFQVTFSDQSMQELNRLPIDEQLALVDRISTVSADQLSSNDESIGRFSRDGRAFYRVRAGEFRCYFEITGDTLFAHYILHSKSLTDFIYRNKLPVTNETMAEQSQSFWRYLETLRKPDDQP